MFVLLLQTPVIVEEPVPSEIDLISENSHLMHSEVNGHYFTQTFCSQKLYARLPPPSLLFLSISISISLLLPFPPPALFAHTTVDVFYHRPTSSAVEPSCQPLPRSRGSGQFDKGVAAMGPHSAQEGAPCPNVQPSGKIWRENILDGE